jgi:hypothetical protein
MSTDSNVPHATVYTRFRNREYLHVCFQTEPGQLLALDIEEKVHTAGFLAGSGPELLTLGSRYRRSFAIVLCEITNFGLSWAENDSVSLFHLVPPWRGV